jgi:predicted Zn-dependent protease
MADGQERNLEIRDAMQSAQGFYDLGMLTESWTALDDLPSEDKAHSLVIMLRLDILLALHRLDDAVALGTGACRQWPTGNEFFLKTASALIDLTDHQKAKDLLLAGPSSLQENATYWYDLARCYGRLGEVDQGRKCLWECINRDKSFRERALDDPDLEDIWESL